MKSFFGKVEMKKISAFFVLTLIVKMSDSFKHERGMNGDNIKKDNE